VPKELESRLGKVLAQLLVNRGLEPESFLNAAVPPAESFNELTRAAEFLLSAVKKGKRILLYGDYDVDGITGTAVLYRVLKALGGRVYPVLPNRQTGYGLSRQIVKVFESYGEVLVTVDNGTSAVEEIDRSRLEVLVLDHHNAPSRTPERALLVNPKLLPEDSPFKHLSSSALSFLLASLIIRETGTELDEEELLGLAALGVLADYVPLKDANRAIALKGLKTLQRLLVKEGKLPGLRSLMELAGLERVTSSRVYFDLAPRLNAPGRISRPQVSFKLLLAKEEKEARQLAEQVEKLNDRRRRLTRKTFREAIKLARRERGEPFIVLWKEGWHPGVLGIVAGRLSSELGKPVALFSVSGKKAVGSLRSSSEELLFEKIQTLSRMFLKWGGHDKAMGLTLRADDLPLFKERVNELFSSAAQAEPTLEVDLPLPLNELSGVLEELERLEPYGEANPYPAFVDRVQEVSESGGELRVNRVRVVCYDRRVRSALAKGKRFVYSVRDGTVVLEDVEDGAL